jgi:hypothetical protein
LILGVGAFKQRHLPADQLLNPVKLAFPNLRDQDSKVMPLNLNSAFPEEQNQPFAFSVILPVISTIKRPREALRVPSIPSLDMEIESLRGVLALLGERLAITLLLRIQQLFEELAFRLRRSSPLPGRASNRLSPLRVF